MKRFLYTAAQIVWGFPQTLLGAVVFCIHARKPHFNYHGAVVTIWETRAGLSLGPFIFINATGKAREGGRSPIDAKLLVHEYGHTVQSLVLGPLYLLVIGLPSLIWQRTPALSRKRGARGISYYSFYTERWANYLGERTLGSPSMGQALID